MAKKRPSSEPVPVGELIRGRRMVLRVGLREMAIKLSIAPAHLTDIEKGRRTPSEDLMLRIAREYGMPEEDLRSGWSRADAVVNEMATVSPTNAKKVPEFLRTAGDLTPEQWDTLIKQAKLFSKKPTNGGVG